jgi:hypothetical protein
MKRMVLVLTVVAVMVAMVATTANAARPTSWCVSQERGPYTGVGVCGGSRDACLINKEANNYEGACTPVR